MDEGMVLAAAAGAELLVEGLVPVAQGPLDLEPVGGTEGLGETPWPAFRGSALGEGEGLDGVRVEDRVLAEGVTADELVAAGLTPADSPEDADVALVRLTAPFEARDDLFLEAWFHQGSLDFPPGLVSRLRRIAARCPLVVDVSLDRPAVLTPLVPVCTAITATYGSSDEALLTALTGRIPPVGRLPFDVPASMEAVRRHPEDVPGFGVDALYRFGHGLDLPPG